MFPSPSDRRAWLPVASIVVIIVGLALLFGAGPWMSENLLPLLFAISASAHLLVLFPAWLLRKLLSKVTGMEVRG